MGRILNCSPENGNLITENTAKIIFLDSLDSVANIYFNSRKTKDGKTATSSDFDHYEIDNICFDKKYGRSLYDTLWFTFLKKNPSIVEEIRSYDDFSDGTKTENCINSTARVFRVVKKYGLTGLHNNCKKFMSDLAQKNKEEKQQDNENSVETSRNKPEKNIPNITLSDITTTPENEDDKSLRIKRFKELDNMVINVIKTGYEKCSKEKMIKTAKAQGYEKAEENIVVRLIEVRYDEYSKNSTPAYIQKELMAIRQDFINAGINKESENKIVLE